MKGREKLRDGRCVLLQWVWPDHLPYAQATANDSLTHGPVIAACKCKYGLRKGTPVNYVTSCWLLRSEAGRHSDQNHSLTVQTLCFIPKELTMDIFINAPQNSCFFRISASLENNASPIPHLFPPLHGYVVCWCTAAATGKAATRNMHSATNYIIRCATNIGKGFSHA